MEGKIPSLTQKTDYFGISEREYRMTLSYYADKYIKSQGIPYQFERDLDGNAGSTKVNTIGMPEKVAILCNTGNSKSKLVSDFDVINGRVAIFHEAHHCKQALEITQASPDSENAEYAQILALSAISCKYDSDFYQHAYWKMPFEIDAECIAIEQAYTSLQDEFGYDEIHAQWVDKIMTTYVNDRFYMREKPDYPIRKDDYNIDFQNMSEVLEVTSHLRDKQWPLSDYQKEIMMYWSTMDPAHTVIFGKKELRQKYVSCKTYTDLSILIAATEIRMHPELRDSRKVLQTDKMSYENLCGCKLTDEDIELGLEKFEEKQKNIEKQKQLTKKKFGIRRLTRGEQAMNLFGDIAGIKDQQDSDDFSL